MNVKLVGVVGVGLVIFILAMNNQSVSKNEELGLVINSPESTITLQRLDAIYETASSTGIGRSNVYMFWNLIEPKKGEYDWSQYDSIMNLNEKNDLKVTLYFSLINGATIGPFPDWMGDPTLRSIPRDGLVDVLDAIMSRYEIIDYVIISGGTSGHFRHQEQEIPAYKRLFDYTYEEIKERHPDVKIGNSFELHSILNKNLISLTNQLKFGDFVAFTYMPTDILNDITKTPTQAIEDLEKMYEIVPDKKIGIFEISWSTSKFVNGSNGDQTKFINKLYNFAKNKDIEFLTWYRLYDRPQGTCSTDESKLPQATLGNSTFVIERLGSYLCNAGLFTTQDAPKQGWNKFTYAIKSIP